MKINELLFSLAVRPTDRATAGAAAAVPSPILFLASCGMVDSKRRKDGKSRGEEWREGETVVVLPFLPLLHALDNPSGGSNSLFEGQFHCCRHRLCRIGDGNTSWTSLSLSPSPHRRSPSSLPIASWSRVQEMGLLNFKSMLMLPVAGAVVENERQTAGRVG